MSINEKRSFTSNLMSSGAMQIIDIDGFDPNILL